MTDSMQRMQSWSESVNPDTRPGHERPGSPGAGPLVPNVDLPLGPTVTYKTLTMTSVGQTPDGLTELEGPIDPLGAVAPHTDTPAEGVLLSHEQAWRMKGVTIGRLLHSMSLAPGEVTQVAVTTWDRRTHGQSQAMAAESEYASQSAARDRSISDIVSSVADEHQFSFGSASSSSSQSSGGVNLGIFNASGSSNSASASSIGISSGGRSASADSTQRIRQSTQQHASNARGRRATVVQEVGQGEGEQFRTRVVANYNHTHSLNMLYFEVLQVYELSTRVVEAERCIFLPMQVMEFTPLRVAEFARSLAQAARWRGDSVLATAIDDIEMEMETIEIRIRDRLAELNAAHSTLARSQEVLHQARYEVRRAAAALAAAQREAAAQQTAVESMRLARQQHLEEQRRGNFWEQIGAELEEIGEEVGDLVGATHLARAERRLLELNENVAEALARESQAINAERQAERDLELATSNHQGAEVAHAAELEASKMVGQDVVRQLEVDRTWFNHALWYQLEPSQVAHMLAGKTLRGQSLVETVDPQPLAVFGNYVAFRWNFGPDATQDAERYRRRHLDDDGAAASDTIVIPTDAVFAEAVPGSANSAEKIDLTRYWKWDEKTIPILPTGIAKIHQQNHAQPTELRPTQLGAPSVQIGALPDAPAGPGHHLASVVGSQLFRNISGSDTIEGLMTKAQQVTGEGATHAQTMAHESVSALLDHVEEMAPKVMELLNSQSSGGSNKQGGGPLDPSTIGGLQNAFGGGGGGEAEGAAEAVAGEEGAAAAGIDTAALLGEAAELGVFLL